MNKQNEWKRHYEENVSIGTSAKEIFDYVDNHSRFSSHMNQSSWMMGGGSINTELDKGQGQKVGSHIRMNGKIFGINLFLDEIITKREPPYLKVWKTVGTPQLLVIGNYQMGFEINDKNNKSHFRVFIDYDLPTEATTHWLGFLLGGIYAKWCVHQMTQGVKSYFDK